MRIGLSDSEELMCRARDRMAEYKARTGRYADEWFLLGMKYSGSEGDWRVFDRYTLPESPRASDGARWRPSRMLETFVIQRADESGFLIQAIERDGAVLMELDETMELRTLKDPSCSKEYERLSPEGTPPVLTGEVVKPASKEQRGFHFLSVSRFALSNYFSVYVDYPTTWEQLGMHWAEVKHTERDPRAYPPPGTGTSWKPLGSAFTYTLERINEHEYVVRSFDEQGRLRNLCTPFIPPVFGLTPEDNGTPR